MKKTKNYTLKVFNNRKITGKVRTHSVRLFLTHLRSIKWEKSTSVYLRVSYRKKIDSQGKLSTFWNDGDYDNKSDLMWAFNAFNEEG